jgi:hypothetical protein
MPAIRLEATGELAGNWIDLSDVWTRAEMRDWYAGALAANDAVWLPILQRKLAGVHVHLADGALVEDAATFVTRLDDLDIRLVRWLSIGVMSALQELMHLGEAQKRLLFAGVEVAAPMKRTTPVTTE